jgi:hypothetical protein
LPPPSKEIAWIEIAQHEIGIGDRGGCSAEPIAGRPGIGACTLRPDRQQTRTVNVADRAAAGSERDDIEARQRDPCVGDSLAAGQGRLPVAHKRDVG